MNKKLVAIYVTAVIFFIVPGCSNETTKQGDESPVELEQLVLKVAGYDLDRLNGMFTGEVSIDSCKLEFHKVGIGDANTAAFSGAGTYDVTEIGLHPYMLAYANENFRDYTLIPVFPIRAFRHKSIYIRSDKGIASPSDLKGRTIGTPGFSSTSLTWIRGILSDEYGVEPQDINWVISNKDSSPKEAGNISKQEQVIPNNLNVTLGTAGKDDSELLLSGEVDALFHAAEPKAFMQGNPLVERLFSDTKQTERAYFKKTGIFPMMHAVAIKKELVDKYPWLPQAVFNAYSRAKAKHFMELKKIGWAYSSLPWFAQEFEETIKLMGDNYWAYGIEANRKALETLFRYSYEQGLSNTQLTIEELFHHSTLGLTE